MGLERLGRWLGEGVLSPPPSLSIDRIETDLLCLWLGGGPFGRVGGALGGGKLCDPNQGEFKDEVTRWNGFFEGLTGYERRPWLKGDFAEKNDSEFAGVLAARDCLR